MKTTKTFENATLRTVNTGYIELDYNSKTHCFHNASVVSINNGSISIEIDWEPKEGELVKITGTYIDAYCIIDRIDDICISVFGWKKIDSNTHYLKCDCWLKNSQTKISTVTPEEQETFDDFCKSKGKIWNKEKLQWEEYRWKPKHGDMYYCVNITSSFFVICHVWRNDTVDSDYYDQNNCFKTKEEAEAKLEQIKKLLLEV